MTETGVSAEQIDQVLEIRIDRPPANAISRAVSRELYAALEQLNSRSDLAVGIITGGGDRIFSGGWDLKAVAEEGYDQSTEYDPVIGHGPGGFAGISEFFDLGKPVIAAVNGAAVGGGMEMCLPCDIIVMAEGSFFQLPELARGLIPDGGAVQRLPQLIPPNVAREMMLTGRRMQAAEAQRWGLAHAVVPLDQLMPTAHTLARSISEGAPLAVRALKEALRYADGKPSEQLMRDIKVGGAELPTYQKMHHSEDMLEGIKAFTEKRAPRWRGQ